MNKGNVDISYMWDVSTDSKSSVENFTENLRYRYSINTCHWFVKGHVTCGHKNKRWLQ